MKRAVFSLVLLAIFLGATASTSQATLVPAFSFEIRNPTAYGGFTVVFSSSLYDDSGQITPPLTSSSLRLPAGAKLRREFLKQRNLCNVQKLEKALASSYSRAQATCKRAKVGFGTALADTRVFHNAAPAIPAEVPGTFDMFLAKCVEFTGACTGSDRHAIVSLVILARSDQNSPVVKAAPDIVKNFTAVLLADFVNDPSPDGVFGYRLVLPAGAIPGVNANIPIVRVNATTKGLTLKKKKRTCAKKKKGRCVKRKVTQQKIFWFTRPPCPQSGELKFQANYTFEGLAPISLEDKVPCPSFPG